MQQFLASVSQTPLTPASVRTSARVVANAAKPQLEQEIRALGLVRPARLVTLLTLLTLLGGAVCMLIGAIRIAARAAVSGGDAPLPIFLLICMFIVALITLIIAFTAHRKSSLPKQYIAWLTDATTSLRSDVEAAAARARPRWRSRSRSAVPRCCRCTH